MELKNIEYLIAIAEELSLSHAAEKLYVSQPALSKYLSKIEDSIGTPLFIRYNGSLSLTEAGEAYLRGARAVMDISRTVDKQLDDIMEESRYALSIGVTGERSQRFLGKLLLTLYEEYPRLRIHVIEEPAPELAQKLKCGDLDLAIYAVSGIDNELTQLTLRREEVLLALPRRHRLAYLGKPDAHEEPVRIDLQELRDDAFVLLKKCTAMRQICEEYFDKVGFHPNEVIETKGSYSSMVFVDSGIATGFCPCNYDYKSDQVCYLGLTDPFYYSIAINYRRSAYLTKPMKSLIRLAQCRADSL